jgi:hypothetical protein
MMEFKRRLIFQIWDEKSRFVVAEEADPHQAAMVTIEVNQAKMENQEIIPGVTKLQKFVPHGIGKDRQTLTYQTVKEYIIQLVQKSFRNG